MLRIQKLPEILDSTLNDGIDGVVLMTAEGSVLCSKFIEDSKLNETTLAAITSNIWSGIIHSNPDVTFHMVKLEEVAVAITIAERTGYLIAAYGSRMGMLRGRLEALSEYFGKILGEASGQK